MGLVTKPANTSNQGKVSPLFESFNKMYFNHGFVSHKNYVYVYVCRHIYVYIHIHTYVGYIHNKDTECF